MAGYNLKRDDIVRLITQPCGASTHDLPLAIGDEYVFLDYEGSNVRITTDEPHLTASINRERVEFVRHPSD